MTAPMIAPTLLAELEAVYTLYTALAPALDPQTGLGGKLLYAGELDLEGARLVRAANIAGAASLSAAPDPASQRSAIRDGVIDFLVTSLDEALRILKNEIRKHNAVSVGVSASHAALIREMRDRGVLPDLLRADLVADLVDLVALGAQPLKTTADPVALFAFHLPATELEQRALASIPDTDDTTRRWFRLSHRYLGPQARRIRSLPAPMAKTAGLMGI